MTLDPPIDVTSCDTASTSRQFLPGYGVTLRLRDGQKLYVSQVAAGLAVKGGGRFIVAYPNPLYDQPITREQFEEQERQREEEEALEAYYENDY